MPVENYKIGKNILEILTSGMYTDSRFIYREYVQNAADAIDEAIKQGILAREDALIDINIDNRRITIEDNATGISKTQVGILLGNVADSIKDKEVNKGFRGIGRLGGLAYCKKLIFETSVKGEIVKTIITWDADLLQKILDNSTDKSDAVSVMQKIVKFDEQEEASEKHYFRVILQDIKPSNDVLLNKNEIREYLGQVAPVDFEKTKFILCVKIKENMKQDSYVLDTYNIRINHDNLYKIYTCALIDTNNIRYDDIFSIDYRKFYNSNNELLAWSWVGISKFDKCIPEKNNPQRGIRLKKANIQLGDSETLNKLHKESRGNGYFIGEIHAVHRDLIPNARRDYFNENKTSKTLENKLKEYFSELYKLYHDANDAKNAIKKQNDYIQKKQDYKEKADANHFINIEEKQKYLKQIEEAKEKAEKAQKDLERIQKRTSENATLERVVSAIKEEYTPSDIPENPIEITIETEKENKKFRTDNLNKLSKAERKLVSKIYAILDKVLDPDTRESIISKIEEEFS